MHTTPARRSAPPSRSTSPPGARREVVATVRLDPADAARDAKWFHAMAWQGGGSRLVQLREIAPGTYRTAEPIPVHGDWKAMLRLHTGSAILAMPVYMPGDAAIPAREVPATAHFDRAFQIDHEVLRREERGAASWLTGAAYGMLAVVALAWLLAGRRVRRRCHALRDSPTALPPRVVRGMKRVLIIPATLAALLAPLTGVAAAKTSKADKREAKQECRALRGDTDATREAFRAEFRNFGACVKEKAAEAKAERKQAKRAAKDCRDERSAGGGGVQGQVRTSASACRRRPRPSGQEQDADDAAEAEDANNAAQECDTERSADREAFQEKYGTNHNKKNAFGKCVSQKAHEGPGRGGGRRLPSRRGNVARRVVPPARRLSLTAV